MEEINFGKIFNYPIDNLCLNDCYHCPNNIKSIKFGNEFNQFVNKLPNSLERIIFGEKFNQSIDFLPNSVRYISFDWICDFNQPIYKLPYSLEEIYFGNKFSNVICKLPDGLKKITLGTNFDKPIIIPKNLEKIKLPIQYKFLNIIKLISNKYVIKELY